MTRYLLALVAVLNGAMLPAAPLSADQGRVGEIAIEKPWARASIGTSRPAVAYFTVRNLGSEPDRLMSVTSPASGMAEIHATTQENGVMRMRPAGPQDLPPGGRLILEPGGLHLMLMQLSEPLVKGRTVALELKFELAGTVTVDTPIVGPGETRSSH